MSSSSPIPDAPPRGRPRASAPVLLLALVSCASYPRRMDDALRDFQGGKLAEAQTKFADEGRTRSEFLAGAEAGTVALTAGDWDGALEALHRAVAAAEDIEGRALAGKERLGEGLASWALSDGYRAYQGEGFERVYVHTGLAQAYLARGLMDDVFVEARLANRLLEAEEELYERRYGAGGWGHLMSALAYELLGQPDQAYVDYLRMEEKGVGTEFAGPALVRLATQMYRDEDLERWIERYGPDVERPQGAANVVVLAGVGMGPYKVESKVVLPTEDGLFSAVGVGYASRPQELERLTVRAGALEADTILIEDVERVARENLADRQAWMLAKSVARGLLKRELTKTLEDEYGGAGRVAGDVFAFVSERADLRCWLTLPKSWQAVRLFVPPGVHDLTLLASGGEAIDLGAFELEPGETMLVFARTIGRRIHAHAIGGRPVEEDDVQGGQP